MTPALVAAAVGLGLASALDASTGRIPNWLTGAMIAVGLAIGGAEGALGAAALGFAAALLIHFPLWVLQIEKAGDAKLMMGVGALLYWPIMLEATVWCALLYLPIGLGVLAFKGRLGNLRPAAVYALRRARGDKDLGERPELTMLRTGPIIAVATALAVATGWLDALI